MRVLVADKLSDAGISALAVDHDVDVRIGMTRSELVAAIPDYDAIVIRSATTVDADVLRAGTRLKVVARAGIGLDNVDVDTATARGVLVCNAPQSNVISAAEHTVALLLSLARRVPAADASLREGRWDRAAFSGVELHGRTLGVLGLGRVGTLVAQRCSSFGMRLVGYDPFVSAERAARMGVELVPTVDEICREADVLTVHLPKNAETTGIIGAEQLQAMKPDALLVNTARGGIVDEEALYTAVSQGWIGGAALDVYAHEPMTESPLFSLDRVVVTPHLGASTVEAQDKAGVMVAEAVRLALAGEYVPSAVNVAIREDIPEQVRPFMPLAEDLGRLFTALHAGAASELTVELHGEIARSEAQPIVLSALRGLLGPVVAEPVTFVNAPLIAEERGLKVVTLATTTSEDFVSVVRLCAGDVRVAGTLVGPGHRPRLVEVWGYALDMEPSDHMVLWRYVDRPGVVGIIGQTLGEAQVNIASMQVSRREAGGEAMIVMGVDDDVDEEVVASVTRRIGASEGRRVSLV